MVGELEGGDLGGEVDADFATFLKNREADLFSGRGCGELDWACGGICSPDDGRGSEGESLTAVGDMVAGS